ncbi:MAG: FRG domain-containing protein [Acholeplasmatales bacterium]|nr:FRG domain-containing protein [Acholeplasmatales bacterium]
MVNNYELIHNNIVINGAFFKDDCFGSFFITTPTLDTLEIGKSISLKVSGNIVTTYAKRENTYDVYKINREKGFMYVFAKKANVEDFEVNYLSFVDLSLYSNFELFTGGDVLDSLASICKLPSGNYVVGSVQDYISAIEDLKLKYPDKEEFYRGHYYYKYNFVPSLYRNMNYAKNEDYMYMDFKSQFYNELNNKKYIEILTTMQHYKMPTRLLDTTSNPLVALFMACEKPINYKTNKYGIGEVIVMNEDRNQIKYSDSNSVTLLSSLAVIETKYKQELYEKFMLSIEKNDKSIYQNTNAYKRFVAEVKNELPSFDESFFSPKVLLKPIHVKVGMINERILAQSGNFVLFGLCNYDTNEYEMLNTIAKERIFIVHRDYIIKQLELLNIHEGTMYPDKDHMSHVIVKGYNK